MKNKYTPNPNDRTEIQEGEYHPSANSAMRWFNMWKRNVVRYMQTREAIASTAIEGNRLSEILSGTLDRLEKGEPVSDRYLLGLCWFLRGDGFDELLTEDDLEAPSF